MEVSGPDVTTIDSSGAREATRRIQSRNQHMPTRNVLPPPPATLRRVLSTFCGLILTLLHLGAAEATPKAPVTVTLYNTGDIHDHTQNLARIAHFIKERKRQDANVLFVDAGDIFNKGELAAMFTRGEAVISTMRATGYDACILGNHGGSFGTARLAELVERYQFPLLAANCVWPDGLRPKHVAPYRIFALQGVRVAVIGTLAEGRNHSADDLLKITRVDVAVRDLVPELRKRADIVVLVTHVGTGRDLQIAKALAAPRKAADGTTIDSRVDLIIGAHDHRRYTELLIEPESQTAIQHSGDCGRCLGEVVLTWDGTKIVARRSRIIPVTPDMTEDKGVRAVRQKALGAFSAGTTLATLPAELERDEVTRWLAEAVRRETKTHAVLIPIELAQRALPAGTLTPEALLKAVPRLAVVTFTLKTKEQLNSMLAALREKNPTLTAHVAPGAHLPDADLRVAYPCVPYDRRVAGKAAELRSAGALDLVRLTERSLWQIALASVRAQGAPALSASP